MNNIITNQTSKRSYVYSRDVGETLHSTPAGSYITMLYSCYKHAIPSGLRPVVERFGNEHDNFKPDLEEVLCL